MSETATGGAAASQAAKQLTRQQKAAAVVISLGAEKASQLYQYMDPDDVEQITLEVAKLGYVDAATTEDVLNEYYQMCLTNKAVTEGGLEYARAVLEKAFGEQAAELNLQYSIYGISDIFIEQHQIPLIILFIFTHCKFRLFFFQNNCTI